jgi:hypothetical protein
MAICCFSAKHIALKSKNIDWLAQNQDNVSEWCYNSTHRLLFKRSSTKASNYSCWWSTERTSSSH